MCIRDSADPTNGHGSNANPTAEIYPQLQEPLNTSREPNYTSAAGNPNRLNWDDSIYVDRFIFPANYHAYLQIPTNSLAGAAAAGVITQVGPGQQFDNEFEFCGVNSGSAEPGNNYNRFAQNEEGTIFQCNTRIRTLKESLFNVLSTITNVRVGVLRFNGSDGGSLIKGIVDIDEGNNRQELIETVMSVTSGGSTPLQESLYNDRLYFGGLQTENETSSREVLDSDLNIELVDGGRNGIRLFDDDGNRVRLFQLQNDPSTFVLSLIHI